MGISIYRDLWASILEYFGNPRSHPMQVASNSIWTWKQKTGLFWWKKFKSYPYMVIQIWRKILRENDTWIVQWWPSYSHFTNFPEFPSFVSARQCSPSLYSWVTLCCAFCWHAHCGGSLLVTFVWIQAWCRGYVLSTCRTSTGVCVIRACEWWSPLMLPLAHLTQQGLVCVMHGCTSEPCLLMCASKLHEFVSGAH